jgi:hypothetical protein
MGVKEVERFEVNRREMGWDPPEKHVGKITSKFLMQSCTSSVPYNQVYIKCLKEWFTIYICDKLILILVYNKSR